MVRASRERRRHPRYLLPSMYTAISVRIPGDEEEWHGHAYDLSASGMRFEIDRPIEPGSSVEVVIALPGVRFALGQPPARASAVVVWLEEDDIERCLGPVRMACVFTEFENTGVRDDLLSHLRSGRFSLAA